MHKKQHLPEKPCLHCGRPFRWRKKWERVWDEVKYCSDRCRHARKAQPSS
ncbi:DUF2256 domain-containing protein [Xanthomonas campestris]|nr:DUF2256 domain-containing protein [Xanthomonas campestris]MEB1549343.1 DUF2256 domain-containing protein [Xanthomonas campestris pv. campestris]MCC5065094.1 DUF2256 domain-containing protein [Xanthomonas campestris pv. raphani]MCC5072193.1 DUF2256 domain-containing protein [Xanthomonas campestris pv. plantaginis]MCF8828407.1 DUF2256 domain-containing protein [Xanthomonas campestris pv. raphani]MEA9841198.1 DUF2256 domain-containing protein [Xanthomonas campestris pv. raphani]